MRAFVTGASGFLGSAIVNRLAQDNDRQVVCLVRDKQVFKSAGLSGELFLPGTLCYGDLSDISILERMLSEYKIDTVFHLAAQTEIGVGMSDPVGTFETNIRGTWNVMEACRRQGVSRVVVAASDKAYGRTPPPYKEGLPLTPDRPYETSKACTDMIALTYASSYKMSVAVTRCVNLYGPGCATLSTLIPNTIRRILRGEPPMIRNGGRMRRDWLYIQDAVNAYMALATSSYVGPMNFGGGIGITVKEIVDIICDLMGYNGPIEDTEDKHGEIVDQWADTALAKSRLDWEPLWGIKNGLKETIQWYKERVRA